MSKPQHWMLIVLAIMSLFSAAYAEIPHPPILLLTAQENGTEAQESFTCSGIIHGYITLPASQVGKHTLEGIWIGPHGAIVQHSNTDVEWPLPGRRVTDIWLRFAKEGVLWNPLSIQDSTDIDHQAYDGAWKVEVRWDHQPLTKSNFNVHCL